MEDGNPMVNENTVVDYKSDRICRRRNRSSWPHLDTRSKGCQKIDRRLREIAEKRESSNDVPALSAGTAETAGANGRLVAKIVSFLLDIDNRCKIIAELGLDPIGGLNPA